MTSTTTQQRRPRAPHDSDRERPASRALPSVHDHLTAPSDPGALSGPLIGISFIGGAGGGVALADHPYPRPGSTPEEIRRYFGESSSALTGRRGQHDASATALHRRGFIAGGPVHGAGFGALVGALSLAGLRTGELPRPLAITGLASAAAGLLSPLYLISERAALLIPAGRVTGLIVSGVAGARLSRRTG